MRIATLRDCWDPDLPLTPLLRPLLGEAGRHADATSWDRRYDRYFVVADSLFELAPLEHADVVVLPGDWYWVRGTSWSSNPNRVLAERVRPLYERAGELGKPVVAFFTGDRSCDRLPFEGVQVFREGGFRSRLGAFDHSLPAFPEDLVQYHCGGTLAERAWRPKPTIGFCGLARPKPWWKRASRLPAYHLVVAAREHHLDPSPYLGERLRSQAIDVLEHSPLVDTNFVLRDHKVFFRDADARDLVDVRAEYVTNLIDSDYVLCVRGSGNYSYRLFEAMCMGRIPVIVDTDLALPRDGAIDWQALTVWVDRSELTRLPERIASFHAGLAPADFAELQHTLRRTWLDELSPEGFFGRLSASRDWMERGRT